MRTGFVITGLACALVVAVLVSLVLGKYPVGIDDVCGFFLWKAFNASVNLSIDRQLLENILLNIRLPRIMAALFVGASLSISGAAFQAMFINPLVSPGILGVLAGASFGAAVGMVLSKSWFFVQASCFLFGFSGRSGGGRRCPPLQGQLDHPPDPRRGNKRCAFYFPFVHREVPRRPLQPASRDSLLANGRPHPC